MLTKKPNCKSTGTNCEWVEWVILCMEKRWRCGEASVADPDPNPDWDPPDLHVFGPPGFGSISQMY
jgi:hypothetical protein